MGKLTTKGDDFFIEPESEFECLEDQVTESTLVNQDVPSFITEMPDFKEDNVPAVKLKSLVAISSLVTTLHSPATSLYFPSGNLDVSQWYSLLK